MREFQSRVHEWTTACFGIDIAYDTVERNHRFIEEALELVQACGMTQADAHALVNYVYARPAGSVTQEVGGALVTLAALCNARYIAMAMAATNELDRCFHNIEKIRAKQAVKPKGSALPIKID